MNSSSEKVLHLDGWRGIAIISVLFCHFGDRTYSQIGDFGVQMFFALSGLFMSQLLFIKKVPINDFFIRRLTRIIPTFWLFIALMATYSSTLQPEQYQVGAKEIASTFLFLRTYLPSYQSIWSEQWPIGHVWSLNVEEHSYVFLAIGAIFCRRFLGKYVSLAFLIISTVLIFGVILAYVLKIVVPSGASPWFVRSEVAALGLVSAGAIRLMREHVQLGFIQNVYPILPILALTVSLVFFFTAFIQSDRLLAPILLAFSVNYLDQSPRLFLKFLSVPLFRWFGMCSFSLYLWQHPFFVATQKFGLNPVLGAILGIGLGTVSFYVFENPIRLRSNKAWSDRIAAVPKGQDYRRA